MSNLKRAGGCTLQMHGWKPNGRGHVMCINTLSWFFLNAVNIMWLHNGKFNKLQASFITWWKWQTSDCIVSGFFPKIKWCCFQTEYTSRTNNVPPLLENKGSWTKCTFSQTWFLLLLYDMNPENLRIGNSAWMLLKS